MQKDNQLLIKVGEEILRLSKENPELTYPGINDDLQELAQVVALLYAGVLIPDNLMEAYERLHRVAHDKDLKVREDLKVLIEIPVPFHEGFRLQLISIVKDLMKRDSEMERIPVEAYDGLRSLLASLEAWEEGSLQIERIALRPLAALMQSIEEVMGEDEQQ